jgi:CHAT domain-containing protein
VIERVAVLTKGVSRGAGHERGGKGQKAVISGEDRPDPAEISSRPFEHPYYWAAFILAGKAD